MGGEFAAGLADCRAAALALFQRLSRDRRFLTAFEPELDIVVWVPRAKSVSAASERAQRVFEESARRHLHLALADLPAEFFDLERAGIQPDRDRIRCLRSVLMKPEHLAWIDEIWRILDESTDAAG
jgi:hypothetical protein